MKVCLFSGTYQQFVTDFFVKNTKPQLICLSGCGLGLVSYKKEIEGETEKFHSIAKLSKSCGAVVISGLDTDTYGVFRHSAVIAEKGKILGVSDMSYTVDESEFKSGGNLRVYETSIGKIGILVGEDLYYHQAISSLSICDADIIINVFRKIRNSLPQVMMRAGSFSSGVNIVTVADNYIQASDVKGNVLFATEKRILETDINIEKEFHTLSIRRRGYSL